MARGKRLARQLLATAAIVVGALVLLVSPGLLGAGRADVRLPDQTPSYFGYLPLVSTSGFACPLTSINDYESGTAIQYDDDDPVRPAHSHADKNIELRRYVATDPDAEGFVDYGCDDPKLPPQLATLFDPPRIPELTSFYRVHDWIWAESPDPGQRGAPISNPPVTALGLDTSRGESVHVPVSGYDIGGGMEVLVLFADEDTIALRYTREDSSGSPGYTVHVDGICVDPNLLTLYDRLDDPDGPRYVYPSPGYELPNLPAGKPIGVARGEELVVAIADTGTFQDPRSVHEWWQLTNGGAVGR